MTTVFGFPRDGHVYSADEVGRALAGLFERLPNGLPREGVIGRAPSIEPVGSSWQVEVGAFSYLHQVAGSAQISGLSAAEQVSITPAAGNIPAGQARIDLVVWNPTDAELGVIEGTPAASPTKPTATGYGILCSIRVNAGDGVVIAGQITDEAPMTSLAGSERLPNAIAVGVVPVSSVPGRQTVITPVTFPPGMFDTPPAVFVSTIAGAASGIDVSASDVTVNGCNIRRSVDSTRPGGFLVGASWQAVAQ